MLLSGIWNHSASSSSTLCCASSSLVYRVKSVCSNVVVLSKMSLPIPRTSGRVEKKRFLLRNSLSAPAASSSHAIMKSLCGLAPRIKFPVSVVSPIIKYVAIVLSMCSGQMREHISYSHPQLLELRVSLS